MIGSSTAGRSIYPNMPSDQTFSELPLTILSRRCAEESDLFYRRQAFDSRYCYEIFRRAIRERDDAAWERVYIQYRPQLIRWVSRQPSFASSGEEIDYFINRALEKMWTAIPPEQFDKFSDLKSLLRYLQLCVSSVLLDHGRKQARRKLEQRIDLESAERQTHPQMIERLNLNGVISDDFWTWLEGRMKDEKERNVLYGSFVLDLKPREIFGHFGQHFTDVREVYRLKENLIARLRRDPELRAYIGMDA